MTRCGTVEEFIDQFHDRISGDTIFVHTVDSRVVGVECGFAILLANKQPVLAGTCVVLAVYEDRNNQFKRTGMQLAIKRLGPESRSVFAALEAAHELRSQPDTFVDSVSAEEVATIALPSPAALPRPIPRRETQPLRVSTIDGAPTVTPVPARVTQAYRQIASVQIPKRDELPRMPRATPAIVDTTAKPDVPAAVDAAPAKVKPKPVPREPRAANSKSVPTAVVAEGSTETRVPGSPLVLPANPFMDLTDASLEGFVDCRLFESSNVDVVKGHAAIMPAMQIDDDSVLIRAPIPVEPPMQAPRPVAISVERMLARSMQAALPAMIAVEPTPASPIAVEPTPASPIALASVPARPGRGRWPWIVAMTAIAGMLVGVGVSIALRERATPALPITMLPASSEIVGTVVRATAQTDAAPARARVAVPRKMHAVLVRTYPNAARVVVDGRSFGTTPTYVKVPAFTPFEMHITRPGFKPVVKTFTSKTAADRVLVTLSRSR